MQFFDLLRGVLQVIELHFQVFVMVALESYKLILLLCKDTKKMFDIFFFPVLL